MAAPAKSAAKGGKKKGKWSLYEKSGDKIKMLIIKEQTDLSDIFGILRASKIDSQKVKDDLRKEWSKR